MLTQTQKVLAVAMPSIAALGFVTAVVTGGGPETREAILPAGTTLVAGLDQTISTESAGAGDQAAARTIVPITLNDEAQIPAGAALMGEVTHAKRGGRIAGAPELTLRFTDIEIDGERYAIEAEPLRLTGKSDATESALQIGGGAVAGGIVGAVAGGGDDVVEGMVVGAAIGTGVAVATKGGDIVLPAGQKIRVRLLEPVTVKYHPLTDAD